MPDAFEIFTAKVLPADLQFDVEGDLTLLEAAEMGRVQLPSSCRNGTCRTCLCQLTSGRVRHLIEWPGLSAEEKLDGFILPCVATPDSDLRIEAPGALEALGHGPQCPVRG